MRYVFLFFLVWIMPAHAQFQNYSQWEQHSEPARLGYIAGAIDELTFVATGDQLQAAMHYRECIEHSSMNLSQLDTNIKAYVRTQPALQAEPMPAALMSYLAVLCGLPHKQ